MSVVLASPEAPHPLDADKEPGSPVFWLHHTLDESLKAAELEKMYRKRCRRAPRRSPLDEAIIAGCFALERAADKSWAGFCGHFR